MLLLTAHILDPFQKLQSFRKWHKGLDINPGDETSYTTQCQEAFLKYVENKYCVKHRRLLVVKSDNTLNNNLSSFEMCSRSGQSADDPYDLSSNDEEYLIPTNVAETTRGRSDRAARLLTAARLYLTSPSELPQNWGQINPNRNDYHSTSRRLVEYFGYRISPTGGGSKKKCTESMPISPMWHATYSLSYPWVLEWRPVFPLREM
jgi:hypothetical protein